MPFLSLWRGGAGSNCVALGRGAHADYAGYSVTLDGRTKDNCTWAEPYDALLYRIQSSGDTAERYSLPPASVSSGSATAAVLPVTIPRLPAPVRPTTTFISIRLTNV